MQKIKQKGSILDKLIKFVPTDIEAAKAEDQADFKAEFKTEGLVTLDDLDLQQRLLC